MKRRTCFFTFCLLSVALFGIRADDLSCIREVGKGYFDLTPLRSNSDQIIKNVDPNTPDVTLQFNICRYSLRPCKQKNIIAALYTIPDNDNDCIQLTSTTLRDFATYQLIDPNNIAAGVSITMSNGEPASTVIKDADGNPYSPVTDGPVDKFYAVTMNFHCNLEAKDIVIKNFAFNETIFTYVIDMETEHGCPIITLDQVSQFVEDNKIVFTVIGCIIGLLIAFLGLKLFLPTLFAAGFISGFLITLFTFFGYVVTTDSRESTKWILFVFACILGALFGFVTVKANKFGIFVIGCWLGTIISLLLYNAILYKIHTNPAELVLLITLGVLGLGGGLLSLKFYKHVIIIATSLGGSYAFVRSLSLVIGSFPNEIQVIKQIQIQEYDFSVQWPFYVYMNGVFLMTLFSIWVQYKIKKRTEANELDFDAEYFKKVDV